MSNGAQPDSVSFTAPGQDMSSFGATEPHKADLLGKSLKTDSDNSTRGPLVQAPKLPVDLSAPVSRHREAQRASLLAGIESG